MVVERYWLDVDVLGGALARGGGRRGVGGGGVGVGPEVLEGMACQLLGLQFFDWE